MDDNPQATDYPGGGTWKGPVNIVEGDLHLRKRPQPPPTDANWI